MPAGLGLRPPRPAEITHPYSHSLRAAEGWLELGNWSEANHELESLPSYLRGHPAVLALRFQICVHARLLDQALIIGEALLRLRPDLAQSWIDRANALHLLGRHSEALENLRPAWLRFPNNATIAYNLACYCCKLGRTADALWWMFRCIEIPGAKTVLPIAFEDPDLEALWNFAPHSGSVTTP